MSPPPTLPALRDDSATRALVHLLQRAHAGERAAWHAYQGHARAVWSPRERDEIAAIRDSEWVHREAVATMLRALGAGPSAWREALLLTIGVVIGLLCRLGALTGPLGWYAAMDGAGRLEASNVHEYVTAARLALAAGRSEYGVFGRIRGRS